MEGWNWSEAKLDEVNNGIMENKRLDFCLYLPFFHYSIDSSKPPPVQPVVVYWGYSTNFWWPNTGCMITVEKANIILHKKGIKK